MGFLDRLFGRFSPKAAAAPATKDAVAERLVSDEPTAGYKAATPISIFTEGNGIPPLYLFYAELPAMRLCPQVDIALSYYRAGVQDAEFEIRAKDPSVARFVSEQLERFWQTSLPQIQEGYETGWAGSEVKYRFDDDGLLAFDTLNSFAPQDVTLLTRKRRYFGIRVRNVGDNGGGTVDLWGPDRGLAKAFWYVHRGRHGSYFGTSQLLGAWRPYRRLCGMDGAETIIDGAVYRFGYRGPEVYYPPGGKPKAAERQPQGMDIWTHGDRARQIGEQAKSGMSVALPALFDEKGNRLWEINWPEHVLNVDSLINYNGSLEDHITLGIGVPPELIQASETGSGYSGREIPLEGYFGGQTVIANSIVRQFCEQVLLPLVKWNYGPDATFDAAVVPLLKTRQKRTAEAQPKPAPSPWAAMMQAGPTSDDQPEELPSTPIRMATAPAVVDRGRLPDARAEAAVLAALRLLAPHSAKLVRQLLWIVLHAPASERMDRAAKLLRIHRDTVAIAMGQASLAGALAAWRRVVDRLPGNHTPSVGPPAPPPPNLPTLFSPDGQPPKVRLTLIDEAVADLQERRILTQPEFYAMADEARDGAFTVAGVTEASTLERIRDLLAQNVQQGADKRAWSKAIRETLDADPFLSPAHQGNVFRTNVHAAYSKGMDRILELPLVGSFFPYEAIDPILDNRVRDSHAIVATSGLNGTNVYRRDDPVMAMIRPPSDYNCRCGRNPLSINMAAARGVQEAIKWKETGQAPMLPEWVPTPPGWPTDSGYRRMSTRRMATKPEKGRWITIGGSKGEGGKRSGGSPVYIVNGRIEKGHPSLTGKKLSNLKEDGPDESHRKELNRSKDHARAKWAKKAKESGHKPEDIHSLASQIRDHDRALVADRVEMLKSARKYSSVLGSDIRNLRTKAGKGGDAASVRHLDDVAASMVAQYPEQFAGADDPLDRLYELLAEGNPEPMTEDDAYSQALDQLDQYRTEAGDGYGDEWERGEADDSDFAGDADFDFGGDEPVAEPEKPAETADEYQEWLKTPDGQEAMGRYIDSAKSKDGLHAARARKLDPKEAFESSKRRDADPWFGPHADDHVSAIKAIAPGSTGYVAGHPVIRKADGTVHLETDKYHVQGEKEVAERIQRHWKDQLPDIKRIGAALRRSEAYTDPHPFMESERSDADNKARNSLKPGTRAVSLDHETRGRIGTVVRDDTGGVGIRLDGTPNAKVADFEPLDEGDSWRSDKPKAAKPAPAVTPPLFMATAAELSAKLSAAAEQVDGNPSDAQKEAGNYTKGHLSWNGLAITIETAKGQTRSGVGKGGAWSITMQDHYGYIKRTESAADGDQIDVFISEDYPDSHVVFVVNQMRQNGSFDEHKCVLGQISAAGAREAYLRNYADGWTGCGSIHAITLPQFKQWIESGDTSKPFEG